MATNDVKDEALWNHFVAFAKFGDTTADGRTIKLSQIDKWFKQAGVIDKKITTTDTAITFNKLKSKTITYEQFNKFVADLAAQKQLNATTIVEKLIKIQRPGLTDATKAVKTGGVERLTDVQGYTGAHKSRFDADGKGKGIEGREDIADTSGYVTGFKDKKIDIDRLKKGHL